MPPPPVEGTAQKSLLVQTWLLARRHTSSLLILVFVAGAAAGALTGLQPRSYVSAVTFVVQSSSGANDTETLIRTMQSLVTSEVIGADLADAANVNLSPEEVVDRLAVSRPPGAGVINVSVTDGSAARSQVLAQQFVPVFESRVGELAQASADREAVTYSIRPWGTGAVSTSVVSAPLTRNPIIGISLGAVIGVLLLVLRAQRRPVLLGVEDAREAYRLPMLGAIPRRGVRPAEALDVLLPSAGLVGWPTHPRRVLVIASGEERDRKGFLVDLARALPGDGGVVLVDSIGGSDSLTSELGLRGKPGLRDLLVGKGDLKAVVPLDAEPGRRKGTPPPAESLLRVLPAGGSPDEKRRAGRARKDDAAASGVLSARLPGVLDQLSGTGVVIVDAPQYGGFLPWAPLLDSVDAVLVVASIGGTAFRDAQAAGDYLLARSKRPVAVLLLDHHRFRTAEDLLPPEAEEQAEPAGSSPTGRLTGLAGVPGGVPPVSLLGPSPR